MSNKIEGVPEGWELVRIDQAKKHEFYLDGCGEPRACRWDRETAMGCAIVRKIEPPKPIDPGEGWRLLEPHEPKQKGDECKFDKSLPQTDWMSVDLCSMKLDDMVYRRRIETYVPWTFDTMPDCVRVKAKQYGSRFMARPISDSSCLVKMQINSYQYLLDHYTQLDGTPCGTIEVQE